jgi:hypothetical protein
MVRPEFQGEYTLDSTYSEETGTLALSSTRLELTGTTKAVDNVYTLGGGHKSDTGAWLYLWELYEGSSSKIGLVFSPSGDSGKKLIATGPTASAQLTTELVKMDFTGSIDVSGIGTIPNFYGEEP